MSQWGRIWNSCQWDWWKSLVYGACPTGDWSDVCWLHEDAGLDMGDSAITETYGVGGFAMAAAPAIVPLVGGTVAKH